MDSSMATRLMLNLPCHYDIVIPFQDLKKMYFVAQERWENPQSKLLYCINLVSLRSQSSHSLMNFIHVCNQSTPFEIIITPTIELLSVSIY